MLRRIRHTRMDDKRKDHTDSKRPLKRSLLPDSNYRPITSLTMIPSPRQQLQAHNKPNDDTRMDDKRKDHTDSKWPLKRSLLPDSNYRPITSLTMIPSPRQQLQTHNKPNDDTRMDDKRKDHTDSKWPLKRSLLPDSNYRPITSLTMIPKIQTAWISEEIYYLQLSHRLFPEDQKGWRKGTRGIGDLLYILNEIKTRWRKCCNGMDWLQKSIKNWRMELN